MKNRNILGSGYAVGNNTVPNQAFESIIETNDEWIVSRTGIKERRISTDQNTSDLATEAAKKAIANAGIDLNEIDLLVCATMTPDNITPSTACLIQGKLGLQDKTMMAFDISAACTGFVYALQVASYMLADYTCALVVGVDVNSKIVDYTDRNTCILFGDGAGAVIMKQEATEKEMYHYANATGDMNGELICPGLPTHELLKNGNHEIGYLYQNGSEVFRFAVKALQEAVEAVLEKAGKTIADVDVLIPHQANIRIINNVVKRMKIDEAKVFTNLHKYGNTSGGSIPIALAEAMEQGVIAPGMCVVMVGFGAGFTCAASLVEF
ncbi:3-oxoacyl-ACP synthase [Erysipelotrichaceae bacterium MTC7]|nr:3-oxoacyl-ACP synthase [Erysipelotrichaceae bacterium MTC7]